MTTKTREYILKVPFTLNEWRKGQRYVLAKYTTDEVSIVKCDQRKEGDKVITESHKVLNISKRLPSIILKVLNSKSLLVDEFSINIDQLKMKDGSKQELLVTNKEIEETGGLLKKMNIQKVQEMKTTGDSKKVLSETNLKEGGLKDVALETKSSSNQAKGKSKGANEAKEYSTVSSSCETSYVSQYYDSNTFSLTVKTMVSEELKENVFEQKDIKSSVIDLCNDNESNVYIYKLVSVTVNSMMLGWVCDQVKTLMKNMLIKFQKKMIETESEWRNISEEELVALEKKMIETFMKVE